MKLHRYHDESDVHTITDQYIILKLNYKTSFFKSKILYYKEMYNSYMNTISNRKNNTQQSYDRYSLYDYITEFLVRVDKKTNEIVSFFKKNDMTNVLLHRYLTEDDIYEIDEEFITIKAPNNNFRLSILKYYGDLYGSSLDIVPYNKLKHVKWSNRYDYHIKIRISDNDVTILKVCQV